MSENGILKLENVSKIYERGTERIYALDTVNILIEKGAFLSVVGPSGSGKSTLLHIFGLLDEPSAGKVYVDGMDIAGIDENARSKLRGEKIGFVFQTFNLISTLTVLDNVALPAIVYNADENAAHEKARRILERIGMGDRLHHYPGQLSGGQRQRVAIARALVNNPGIILADEPTGNLDSKTGEEVIQLFRELNSEGKTIIIITHDANIAKKTEKRIRIMDGKIAKVS